MSERRLAERPGPWSPAVGRGPAGGGGDGPGVEGSQAAASENEDLENTKVTSPVAPASDPEPNSSSYRPQMVSPGSEDAAEDLRKAASALEAQALVEQEVLPTDQAQVLNKMAKYQVPQRSGDIVMIQSEHTGAIDILSADLESADLLGDHRKVSPPLMAPPCIWTFAKMKEFKSKLGKEKNSRLVVKRGEVVTIRVPTHPEGKRVCWEFATDDYDIGFGVYFDWTPVTSTDITVQVSDSSEDEDEDEEEEEEIEECRWGIPFSPEAEMSDAGQSQTLKEHSGRTLSQLEMWREAPGAPCEVAMGKSCLCTGGTATETCRLAATTTPVRASTCSSLTTPTPCCATRLSTSTSTTRAEGWLGREAGGRCGLEQAASWGLLFWIGES
uniref:Transmembrane p24 trafficking protein family member 8 n=1 Tax=Equus caballus TaxID=9796 RepID=A0A9L0R8K5_HORSE